MALVCTSCYAGHIPNVMNDGKLLSACSGCPSSCHITVFRPLNQAVCGVNLVWPKTARVGDHVGDVCAIKRSREGPQRRGQWRAGLSSSADKPTGMNGERNGNGGIRTVVTHLETANSNVDDGIEGNSLARVADGPDSTKSKDISTKGLVNTDTGERVTKSIESGETSSYDLSGLSPLPQSSRSGNFQENFFEGDQGILEVEGGEYVSLVWEAGSEIEKVTPEMASLKDRNSSEAKKFSSSVEEEQFRQEEYLLGVKISRQFSSVGAQWLQRQPVTERPIWIPRSDNALYEFLANSSKIQQKIWLMMVVYGKLAWIRLQQLVARKLRALEGILANFPESENDLNAREAELLIFSEKLMNQSARHEEAFRRSQEALHVAEGMVFQLNTQVIRLTEDVASRDVLLRLLQKEASVSSESLRRAAQSRSDAERRITYLEKRVQTGEESLREERDKLTVAVKSAGSLEESARVAENRVADLISEMSPLKALAAAGRRAEYLSAQVNALEQELKSRDSLLQEIKSETKRSTEVLTVAAQIKQDLNTARQREVELTQALEGANSMVKELKAELFGNLHSLRAEQALRQMEKMFRNANLEVQRLRKAVVERDKSIFVMKDEVDLNIGLLNNAAWDREELHKMKLQVEDLKAELGSKDNTLKFMREEMALVINIARQNESAVTGTSSSDHNSLAAAGSKAAAVQVSKPKKKLRSRKQTGQRQSSPSSPQCS